MDVILYGKRVRFELKLTQKLTILFSRMIERNERELFQFEKFPLPISSKALEVLNNDLRNLYSEPHDIESIEDIDFFQVEFKDRGCDLMAFFDLDRRGDLPVKLEVDFYYKTAQSPREHITLKEEPFLVICNGYLYSRNFEKQVIPEVFQNFIDLQYESIFDHLSIVFSALNLKRKFFNDMELLNIGRSLSLKEYGEQDFSAENILLFLKAQADRPTRCKLENNKVILKPMSFVASAIKGLVGISSKN
ncbi:hypothetical protein [Leptospira meyeri]|uniref:hypothetical protein n=1 Tax=Leptospira meyeri TaxID=29508 RepID=UPI0002BD5589|nr:hypothetical protein [Leptospira meyeri]EMJ90292.1 hypothetical protein LEP1GSC196_0197 [Leptospira meyeri serovar Semaranga str. Veldrot Semarang 173]